MEFFPSPRADTLRAKALGPKISSAPPAIEVDHTPKNCLARIDASEFLRGLCARLRSRADRKNEFVMLSTCEGMRLHVCSFAEVLFRIIDVAADTLHDGSPVLISARPTGNDDVLFEVFGVRTQESSRAGADFGVVLARLVVAQHDA